MENKNIIALEEYFRTNKIFERFGIDRIGIFGSYARGERYNDIDLYLEKNLDYEKRMQLKALVENAFHTKVDVVIKEFAEPIILHHALKEMKYATRA